MPRTNKAESVAAASGTRREVHRTRRWKRCSILVPTLFTAGALSVMGDDGAAPVGRQPGPLKLPKEVGLASWYGHPYHGRQSASGAVYDMYKMTAAHRTLPFGTRVRILNLENAKTVDVEINDRGPFVDGRLIDVSRAAAEIIGIVGTGFAHVAIEVLPPREMPRSIGPRQSTPDERHRERPTVFELHRSLNTTEVFGNLRGYPGIPSRRIDLRPEAVKRSCEKMSPAGSGTEGRGLAATIIDMADPEELQRLRRLLPI